MVDLFKTEYLTLWMTFVILISSRSWWFEGVNLLSSPLLSIFGGSIFAKSSNFVFDKINWSGTEMRFQIMDADNRWRSRVNGRLANHRSSLKTCLNAFDTRLSPSRLPNENEGFWFLVKSWPACPHVLGKAYLPGPGPRNLAYAKINKLEIFSNINLPQC